jgi:hypothetical protein
MMGDTAIPTHISTERTDTNGRKNLKFFIVVIKLEINREMLILLEARRSWHYREHLFTEDIYNNIFKIVNPPIMICNTNVRKTIRSAAEVSTEKLNRTTRLIMLVS